MYLPDDVHELANRWRGAVNLSEVCARALRTELEAAETHRSARTPLSKLRRPSELERSFAKRFGLRDAIVTDSPDHESELREALGLAAAQYFERVVSDDAVVGVAGGRQTWCLVRNLSPRNLSLRLTALGVRQNDPEVLHAHANTLITLMSLLYAPRSNAHLVGSPELDALWDLPNAPGDRVRYFLISSCGPFTSEGPLARLLGSRTTAELLARDVVGDFGYAFLSKDGIVGVPEGTGESSYLSPERIRDVAGRKDGCALLVAGGGDKVPTMALALEHRLCNVVVTDTRTAERLLQERKVAS